ncbi:P-loop containing nucleoside triphosphate hydrolase protein [Amanita muscaria]
MSRRNCVLAQTLIGGRLGSIRITTEYLDEDQLSESTLNVFDHARPIGISPGYSRHGRLSALAVVDDEHCRIILFKGGNNQRAKNSEHLGALQEQVLCRAAGNLLAFDMAPLAMLLYSGFGIRITNAIDIQSGFSAVDRKPLSAIRKLVGDTAPVNAENVESVFREPLFDSDNRHHAIDLATRAWVSQFLATYENGSEIFDKVRPINTKDMTEEVMNSLSHHLISWLLMANDQKLRMISKLSVDALRLDNQKPTEVVHSITLSSDPSSLATQFQSQSYNNRVRRNKNIRVSAQNDDTGSYRFQASVGNARGRKTHAELTRPLQDATVVTVTSIGRDDPTTAEAHRAATVLRILQGSDEFNMWFPRDDGLQTWPEAWSEQPSLPKKKLALPPAVTQLNSSQQRAVNTMLSPADDCRLTLVQGPPGTGKTSVIAAFVLLSIALGKTGIWLVAQSNVAVKNIAEKLVKVGFFGWRLLVSADFHFGWHEHLYTRVKQNVIRSDSFNRAGSQLEGASVILCTLSMLSNDKVKSVFMKKIPLRCLIIDEASQIEIGNYVTTFIGFEATLRKVCFIGDDKQLPPHGQEDIEELQSVFELPHLNKAEKLIFLDTQYRMPPQIGNFVSKTVYGDKLKSDPNHPVQGGKERKSGDSYENQAECDLIIKLILKLQEQNKSYRIITPYTSQRQLIEDTMKETPDLYWGDKCFSVDSFQEPEEDKCHADKVQKGHVCYFQSEIPGWARGKFSCW